MKHSQTGRIDLNIGGIRFWHSGILPGLPILPGLFLLICLLLANTTEAQINNGHTGIIFREDSMVRGDAVLYSVIVDSVLPNSPAAREGILPDDKLISINGVPVGKNKNEYQDANILMDGSSNSFITLVIERKSGNKNIRQISYTLERNLPLKPPKPRVYGIGVTLITDSLFQNGKKSYVVRVNTIIPGYPADIAGMRVGDVITRINSKRITAEAAQLMNAVINVLLLDHAEMVSISVDRYLSGKVESLQFEMMRQNISSYIKNEREVPGILAPLIAPDSVREGDRDGDGIKDHLDQCPDQAGEESINPYLNGCPEN